METTAGAVALIGSKPEGAPIIDKVSLACLRHLETSDTVSPF